MGGRADVCVVGPRPADEQGLREATRYERSAHLRGDDPPYGKAIGAQLRFSDGLRRGILGNPYPRSCINWLTESLKPLKKHPNASACYQYVTPLDKDAQGCI